MLMPLATYQCRLAQLPEQPIICQLTETHRPRDRETEIERERDMSPATYCMHTLPIRPIEQKLKGNAEERDEIRKCLA